MHSIPHPTSKIKAQVTVETALSLVVFFTILMGLIECSWMFRNLITLDNASRQTALLASVGKPSKDLTNAITNLVYGIKITTTNAGVGQSIFLRHALSTDPTNYFTWPPDTTNGSSTNNGVTNSTLITVSIRATNVSITRFFPYFNNKMLSSSVTVRREP